MLALPLPGPRPMRRCVFEPGCSVSTGGTTPAYSLLVSAPYKEQIRNCLQTASVSSSNDMLQLCKGLHTRALSCAYHWWGIYQGRIFDPKNFSWNDFRVVCVKNHPWTVSSEMIFYLFELISLVAAVVAALFPFPKIPEEKRSTVVSPLSHLWHTQHHIIISNLKEKQSLSVCLSLTKSRKS